MLISNYLLTLITAPNSNHGDQAQCRTEDNRGIKKDQGNRFSGVSMNTGDTGFEKADRQDRSTPDCSTSTGA